MLHGPMDYGENADTASSCSKKGYGEVPLWQSYM